MQLSFRELRKKDVINVVDGRCLGRIIDLTLNFPDGVLVGITVPGRRVFGFRIFDRTEVYIDQSRIVKIGGDVILVNINCGEVCAPTPKQKPPKPCAPYPPNPCSPCPPPCHSKKEQGHSSHYDYNSFEQRIDQSDY